MIPNQRHLFDLPGDVVYHIFVILDQYISVFLA